MLSLLWGKNIQQIILQEESNMSVTKDITQDLCYQHYKKGRILLLPFPSLPLLFPFVPVCYLSCLIVSRKPALFPQIFESNS